MSFYSGLSSTSSRMIREKGKPISVTLITPGAYNPSTSTKAPDIEEVTATYGVQTSFSNRDVNGTSILATDVRLLIAAGSLSRTLVPGDRVSIGGVSYGVVISKTIGPGPLDLLHIVQLRN